MMADEKQKLFEKQKRQHKHGCRIFRKRFGSRRALGGHMRAHGIINEAISDVDKEPTTTAGSQTCTFRGNSNHDSTNHICENCNIAFPSKKSLIEHRGCCYIVDDGGEEDDLNGLSPTSSPSSYYRGKRTRRGKKPNSSSSHPTTHHLPTEEEYLANCLVMLSTVRMEPVLLIADKEESSASASKEVDEGIHTAPLTLQKPPVRPLSPPISYRMFECKTCKKLFNSHQALGGHRASHKKVKGCFATPLDVQSPDTNNALMEDENNNFDHENNQIGSSSENIPLAIIPLAERPSHPSPKKKLKVHACPNCKREFNSGQALGGHMRCHWRKDNSAATSAASVEPINVNALNLQFECRSNEANIMQPRTQTLLQKFNSSDHQSIDLNLPAPMDDLVDISLRLDLTVSIYLQPGGDVEKKTESATNLNDIEAKESNQNLGEEAESKEVKLAKLWDLKDMNAGEERSTLLQIGTGTMADQQNSDDTS